MLPQTDIFQTNEDDFFKEEITCQTLHWVIWKNPDQQQQSVLSYTIIIQLTLKYGINPSVFEKAIFNKGNYCFSFWTEMDWSMIDQNDFNLLFANVVLQKDYCCGRFVQELSI